MKNLEREEKGVQLLCRGKFGQKRKLHSLKGKLTLTDYKRLLVNYKVRYSLQSLLLDYKRLQKKLQKVGHRL